MSRMRMADQALRFTAFGVLVVVAVLGGLFAVGNALADLSWPAVVTGVLAWLAVTIGLSLMARRAPDLAVPVLAGVVVLVSVLGVLDWGLDLFDRDSNGPVLTVVLLSLLVPLGFLGLGRPRAAAVLLLVPAAALLGTGLLWTRDGGAPPLAVLRGSWGILISPMLVAAALLLVDSRPAHRPRHGAPAPPSARPHA